ncbi:uncharacterized protein [Arachis hypogaea]|uniref:uncharacterized protein isoform X1 n=1 Tax=Arachis hypogaea TaxID=3818 RepID=UPI000DED10C2|nr:uncharacterized protein LOC112728083 isoform X1 [Arachis hypogaea]QHO24895.1 Glutathione S-transferase [Arachis hypogaea]
MSSNQSSSGSAGVKENASEVVIVDDDKEEGELEEGEIDDDGADPEASVTERVQSVAECGVVASDTDSTSHKLSVREVLEGVTVANVEESFEGTCSTHGAIRNDFTDLTYPTELSRRAKINSVMDWQHSNLRNGAGRNSLSSLVGLSFSWVALSSRSSDSLKFGTTISGRSSVNCKWLHRR